MNGENMPSDMSRFEKLAEFRIRVSARHEPQGNELSTNYEFTIVSQVGTRIVVP